MTNHKPDYIIQPTGQVLADMRAELAELEVLKAENSRLKEALATGELLNAHHRELKHPCPYCKQFYGEVTPYKTIMELEAELEALRFENQGLKDDLNAAVQALRTPHDNRAV